MVHKQVQLLRMLILQQALDMTTQSATGWVAATGASDECNISTGAGNDTITVVHGDNRCSSFKITGGTGADSNDDSR